MAGKADFSEDEWKELQQGVTGAGMLVSTAHRDFTDSFGEAKAVAKQLQAHRASDSELVRDLSGTHGTGFGLTASPSEVMEGTINALHASVALLGAKAPDELEGLSRSGSRCGERGRRGQGRCEGRGARGHPEGQRRTRSRHGLRTTRGATGAPQSRRPHSNRDPHHYESGNAVTVCKVA